MYIWGCSTKCIDDDEMRDEVDISLDKLAHDVQWVLVWPSSTDDRLDPATLASRSCRAAIYSFETAELIHTTIGL